MTDIYERSAASALRQIEKYGKPIVLQRATPGTYDVSTSAYIEGTKPPAETVKAVVKDFDGNSAAKLGAQIRSGDKLLLIAAKNRAKPVLGDSFTVDGETFLIVPKHEGGAEVLDVFGALYKVHGRKS